jgi:transcriptional regulator with PAS, ATPase and Fis domain
VFAPCKCRTRIKRDTAFPNGKFPKTKSVLEEFGPVIITQSAKIRDLIKLAERVGASTAPVLLTGESGTGKELFAQLIHESSARCDKRLIRVNCAALPKQLIESELFGHERGSFTDAVTNRKGRFELAEQGSLLLDEISEIPLSTQAKLLRVLESNEFERVGSSESIRHDVRIIAASNQDLNEQIKDNLFRLDLYHRINVVQLRIPPLRERREDLPVLAMHFLERFKHESALELRGFTRTAMQALANHHWPGNVRELRNVIHRACILADSGLIEQSHLELPLPEDRGQPSSATIPEHWLHTDLAEVEREIILAAIDKYGNRQIVADKLGVSPRTLTNKIRRYREHDRGQADAA